MRGLCSHERDRVSAPPQAYRTCCGRAAGTPVVLLHGIGSQARSFLPLMEALDPRFSVLAWNAPGYGDSTPLAVACPDASDYAAALNRLLAELDISRCILIGHSLGALDRRPSALVVSANRVATLVLISPALGYGAERTVPLPPPVAQPARRSRPPGRRAFAASARPVCSPIRPRVRTCCSEVERAMADGPPPRLRPGSCACSPAAACSRMPRRSTSRPPFWVGSQDRITPPANARALFEALRAIACGRSYREIAGAGHAVCQEQPAEVAARHLLISTTTRPACMLEKTKKKRVHCGRSAYIAPPVQRAVRLIRHVAEGNPVLNMSETAKALKINRTTLLRLLHTLEVEGFVERRPSGAGFQVGLSFLELGARALFSQDLVQVAVPVLTRLAETLGLSAHLGVLDGTDVLYLVRRTPNTPLASNIRVGSRLPAHATTMGRMILAFMPPIEIERLYAGKELRALQRAHRDHARGVATPSRRRTCSAGIAWSDAHFEPGISSAAVRGVRLRRHAARRDQRLGTGRRVRRRGAPRAHRRETASGRRRDFPPSRLDRHAASRAAKSHACPLAAGCIDHGSRTRRQSRGRHRRDVGHRARHRAALPGGRRRGRDLRPRRSAARGGEIHVYLATRADDDAARDALRRARQGARSRRFAAAVEQWSGRCDILVNNAGQARMSTFADTTDEAWREELELKFFSQIYPVRAFKPLLDKSDAAAIMAVNSLLAYQPEPYMVATAAARAGAQSLVKSLAREFAPRIRVNSVMLGLIDSGQWQRRFEARTDTTQTREAWIARDRALARHIPLERLGESGRGRPRHRVPVLAGRGLHHRRSARNFRRRLAASSEDEHQ